MMHVIWGRHFYSGRGDTTSVSATISHKFVVNGEEIPAPNSPPLADALIITSTARPVGGGCYTCGACLTYFRDWGGPKQHALCGEGIEKRGGNLSAGFLQAQQAPKRG